MRSSEILTLTRSQVDVKRRLVRLTDTKNNEARFGATNASRDRSIQAGTE